MNMSGFFAVGFYLTTTFFSLLIFLLWLRIFFKYYHISTLHPAGHFIYNLTDTIVKPLEKSIFSKNKAPKSYDIVTLCILIFVEGIKFLILGFFVYKTIIPFRYLLVLITGDLLVQPCNLLFFALIARVILSWIQPYAHHPVTQIIQIITNPLIRLGHKIVPNISGFDFAPFVMMLILKVISLFISASMPLALF